MNYGKWGEYARGNFWFANGPYADWAEDTKQQFLVLRELRDSLVGISDMCARDRNYGIEAYARAACTRADKALEEEER